MAALSEKTWWGETRFELKNQGQEVLGQKVVKSAAYRGPFPAGALIIDGYVTYNSGNERASLAGFVAGALLVEVNGVPVTSPVHARELIGTWARQGDGEAKVQWEDRPEFFDHDCDAISRLLADQKDAADADHAGASSMMELKTLRDSFALKELLRCVSAVLRDTISTCFPGLPGIITQYVSPRGWWLGGLANVTGSSMERPDVIFEEGVHSYAVGYSSDDGGAWIDFHFPCEVVFSYLRVRAEAYSDYGHFAKDIRLDAVGGDDDTTYTPVCRVTTRQSGGWQYFLLPTPVQGRSFHLVLETKHGNTYVEIAQFDLLGYLV